MSSATGTAAGIHVDLDGSALEAAGRLGIDTISCTARGPSLRYTTTAELVDLLASELPERLPPFVLYGSGDFHHLSALWQRRVEGAYHLVSFDNHPDWDVRPPRWGCGGWLKRALDRPAVGSVSVWGCGNFELSWPGRVWRLRDRRLEVHPWAERLKERDRATYPAMTRDDWRERFGRFAERLAGARVYVTIDMDCLAQGEAWSNWEHGLFTADDVCWALGAIRGHATIVGGDLCGFWSAQRYERWTQRFAAWWDHPRLDLPDGRAVSEATTNAACRLWRSLTGN